MASHPITQSDSIRFVDESRYERIDGRLVPRPMPGDVHAEVQDRVKELLKASLSASSFRVLSEWSITRPEDAQLGDRIT